MKRYSIKLFFAFILCAGFATAAFGQVTGGSLAGNVTDASGAAISGATIKLKSKTTGQELTTQTTSAGGFIFPNVAVGEYEFNVEATGFTSAKQNVVVALNQTTSVDVTMQAGGVTGSVDVVAGEPLVQTDNSQLSRSFDTRQVANLPIFNNQNALAELSPNVVQRSSGVLGSGGSVRGTRRFSNRLGFTAAYTFSKNIDDSTNELNSSALNPRRSQDAFNVSNERGLSALDIPHRLAISFNYDIPYLFKYESGLMRKIFDGFQINGIFSAQSGQPITPLSGQDSNRNGDAAGDRIILSPNGVSGTGSGIRAVNAAGAFVPLGSAATVAYVAINPNAQYIQAGPGAIATAGRNTLRSRGFNRTDVVLLKNISFFERYSLQFGAEVFDLFNQRPTTIGTGGLVLNQTFAVIAQSNSIQTLLLRE
jgi:hypothetical protein